MIDYDPASLTSADRVGAWTVFKVGNFPQRYREQLEREIEATPDRMALFRGLLELKWPFDWRPRYITNEELEEDAPRGSPDFPATGRRLELDVALVYTVVHYLHHDQHGYTPKVNLTAKMTRTADGQKLWYDSITEAGSPTDLAEMGRGALAENYRILIEKAVDRLMKGLDD